MADLTTTIKAILRSSVLFCAHASGLTLRSYQEVPARAIVDSVIHKRGLSFVVIFPRQSGKNELQAQIEAYLLTIFSPTPAEIVKVSPTWKPQSINAMRRLERVLKHNLISRGMWSKESGYVYRLGEARIFFFSGGPTTNIVGATASTLLEIDEAQDVAIDKYDKEIAPMAASTNATRVFWGTAWTSQTLLAREKRAAQAAEKADGVQRVFHIDAGQVGEEVPVYREFVKSQIDLLGRNHPFVRTQFYSEEIDEQSGMFPAGRLALMQGSHPPAVAPRPGAIYLFTLDVGGESFGRVGAGSPRPDRDSTALTIFEVELVSFAGVIHQPRFLVVQRVQWCGARQTDIFKRITALVELWKPQRIVVDATGVGEGIAGMLAQAYGSQAVPFKFTQASKSQLGWDLIALIETGRFKDYACKTPRFKILSDGQLSLASHEPPEAAPLQAAFIQQARHCQMEILPGPSKTLRWSVPEGTRDPANGELVHDDLLLSAALCCALDGEQFGTAESTVIKPPDPVAQALAEKVF